MRLSYDDLRRGYTVFSYGRRTQTMLLKTRAGTRWGTLATEYQLLARNRPGLDERMFLLSVRETRKADGRMRIAHIVIQT